MEIEKKARSTEKVVKYLRDIDYPSRVIAYRQIGPSLIKWNETFYDITA